MQFLNGLSLRWVGSISRLLGKSEHQIVISSFPQSHKYGALPPLAGFSCDFTFSYHVSDSGFSMRCPFPLYRCLPLVFVLTLIFFPTSSIAKPTKLRYLMPSAHNVPQYKARFSTRGLTSLNLGSRSQHKRALPGEYTVGDPNKPNALWKVALDASYPFIPTTDAARDLERLYQIAMTQVRSFIATSAEEWNAFGFREGPVNLIFRCLNGDHLGVPWQLVFDLVYSFLERAQMGHVGIFTGNVQGNGQVIEVVLKITQNILDSASEIHGA